MIRYLILGITFAIAAAVQPGPLQTYYISQTIARGWRRTLPAVFAPLLSDGPIIILVLLLLTSLPHMFLNLLQVAGGIFLLYVAYNTFLSWKNYNENDSVPDSNKQQTLMKATMVNLLNPNAYIGWSLVMGPLLIKGWHENPVYGIMLLVSFYSTMIICSAIIILVFASTRKLGGHLNRFLIALSVAALAAFGIYDLWAGLADAIKP